MYFCSEYEKASENYLSPFFFLCFLVFASIVYERKPWSLVVLFKDVYRKIVHCILEYLSFKIKQSMFEIKQSIFEIKQSMFEIKQANNSKCYNFQNGQFYSEKSQFY